MKIIFYGSSHGLPERDRFIVGHVSPTVVTDESIEAAKLGLDVPLTVAYDMAEYEV